MQSDGEKGIQKKANPQSHVKQKKRRRRANKMHSTDHAYKLRPTGSQLGPTCFPWLLMWLHLLGQERKWHTTHLNELTSDLRLFWDDGEEESLLFCTPETIKKKFGRTATETRLRLSYKHSTFSQISQRKPEIKPGVYDKPTHRNEVVNSFWKMAHAAGTQVWLMWLC